MFRIRYKKTTGEVVEWGENPVMYDDEYGIIEEQDDELAQYLTLACSVVNDALEVRHSKLEEIQASGHLEMGRQEIRGEE